MSLTKEKYQAYCDILKEELRLAMGCTEPIAIAYSASVARSYMEQEPTSITINLSGNIIKNVKKVSIFFARYFLCVLFLLISKQIFFRIEDLLDCHIHHDGIR